MESSVIFFARAFSSNWKVRSCGDGARVEEPHEIGEGLRFLERGRHLPGKLENSALMYVRRYEANLARRRRRRGKEGMNELRTRSIW